LEASLAYYEIVKDRIAQLNEEKIGNISQFGPFLNRRLRPAVMTCNTTKDRIERTRQSLDRLCRLLLTHVNIELEEYNQKQLESMSNTTKQQYKLQETVESLSIVAISYYGLGLWSYFIKGLYAYNIVPSHIPYEFLLAGSVPIIVVLVWLIVFRIRKKFF